MKQFINKIVASKYGWVLLLALIVLVNYAASFLHARIDLTKEKRYTLSRTTTQLLKKLEEPIQVDVFLKGEFPSGFRKLANTTREFLSLLKDRNSSKVRYRFISPLDMTGDGRTTYGDSLVRMGAVPINLTVMKKAGESSNIIFPSAIVTYKGKQSLINLYPGANSRITQEEINSAEALMEYQFVKTLDKITSDTKPAIAYATGNGEPDDGRTYDMVQTLRQDHEFGMLDINKHPKIPDAVDVLMIVKPTKEFSEDEKLKIDQFVMRGGKLICFIDNLIAEQDSLSIKPETIAYDRNLNLTDLFFRYGLRINTDLLMDLQCDVIPFVVGGSNDNPQLEFLKWNYYPVLTSGNSKLTKGLGYVTSHFANSIDTIQVEGVRKEPLLVSSPNSRTIGTPALISLNENKDAPEDAKFKKDAIPVAMLLEGRFTSLYRNKLSQSQRDTLAAGGSPFSDLSVNNKIIVVADGDIVLNDFIPGEEGSPEPIQMGWNKYTYTEYLKQSAHAKLFIPVANREFLLNAVEYLVSNPAISETRNKDIVLRLLDSKKITAQKSTWQFINIALPVLLIILLGWIYQEIRKRRYAR
ncbi:MAG TPA: gliding motility-associated ABC transporter substrate-binding protein GldG [Chitinophagaceae bacterium]|nr:gliding motility-associated ABC transporter substrate-binding protein GldG [Chitinophagaceae bacterium]